MHGTVHAMAAAYPQSTLNSTPTGSSLSGTSSYETYVAFQEESGCETGSLFFIVLLWHLKYR